MRKKIIIWSTVPIVLLVGISTCRRGQSTATARNPILAEVKSGPLVISVKGSGNIQAKNSNKIIPKINRNVTISFLIPEGTHASSNDVVARFATEEIDRRLSELESAFTDCQSKLDAAQSECEIQVMDNTTSLKKAEQGLHTAKMELDKFTQGDEPLDRRNAELKVQTADSELVRTQKRYEDLGGLLKEGFVTEDEVEEERMGVEAATVAVGTAKIELKILNEYTLPLKRSNAEGAVVQATTELEKTTKQNATRLQTTTQALELAKRAFERSKTDLEQAKKEREAFDVKSTSDGVVMYGNPEQMWRRGDIQVGAQFYPGQVLMTIPDMAAMQAVVNIPEADIFKVSTSQTAQVTVEAISDKPFPAKVTLVAEVANPDGWWSSGVKEFKVELAMIEGKGLKPGFSCQAEIVTGTIPSCLYLPVQAVFLDDGKYYVYPAKGAGKKKVEVTIGRASTQYVEILEGVKAGTKVLLMRPDAVRTDRTPSS